MEEDLICLLEYDAKAVRLAFVYALEKLSIIKVDCQAIASHGVSGHTCLHSHGKQHNLKLS